MNQYKYQVVLTVEVEAFDDEDAFDKVQEVFGAGDNYGLLVTECKYNLKKR